MEDTAGFREMLRMSYEDFKMILSQIEEYITPHQVNGGNKVISAPERLVLALRFLATGESFKSLQISSRNISYIVQQFCDAIIKVLVPVFL